VFKGQYKRKFSDGLLNTYTPGDTILFQGKLYKSRGPTFLSPVEAPDKWQFQGVEQDVFISENPPLNPSVGQIWANSSGQFYSYYYDGNSYQWVEV
jgi:hypothetical protein